MKASLVSATSLAALLALDASPASAQIFTINSQLGFGNTLVNCAAFSGCMVNTLSDTATITQGGSSTSTTFRFANATTPFSGNVKASTISNIATLSTQTNAYTFSPTISSAGSVSQTINVTETQRGSKGTSVQTSIVTLSGTGVAPVQSTSISKTIVNNASNGSTISVNTANLGYVLENNAPTSAAATITVSNTGTGNSAKYWNGLAFVSQPFSVSNLNGSVSLTAGGGSVTGAGTNPGNSVSLNDSTYTASGGAGTATTSTNYTYQFTPTAPGTAASSVVTLSFSDGNSAGTNVSQVVTYTLTGTGVAPIASIAGTNVGYVLAGTSKSAVVTVQNTGNGNLAFGGTATGPATVSNLFGTVSGTGGGLFSGGGSALTATGLPDTHSSTFSMTTQTVSYVFTPTSAIGTVSSTVTGTFSYGTGNAVSLGTQSATIVGTGVAPISSVSVTKSGGTGGGVTGSSGPGQASGAGAQANLGYVLVQGPTAAATVTVNNTGNGDLAGNDVSSTTPGTLYSNLHGVQGSASSSVFVGSGGTITLQDSNATTAAGFNSNGSTTSTFTYNFAPTISNGSAVTATAITTFTNSLGSNGQYATSTYTTTLVGTGVAPIQSLSNTNAGYALVNAPTVSTTATVTVYNNGNGNLAFGGSSTGAATVSNLQGTVSGLTPPQFGGAGGSLGVGTVAGLADSTSQNFTYTFAPTITGQATTTVTAAFSNGSNDGRNLNTNATATIVGTGVAPIQSVAVTNAGGSGGNTVTGQIGYVLVQSTATATLTVNNTGNGNLSGAGTISNLQGSVSGLTPPYFNGTGGNLGAGTVAGLSDTTSQNFTYVYQPTIIGSATGIVTTTFTNGSTDGQNLAGSVLSTLTGTGVAPINSVGTANALSRFNAYGRANAGTGTATLTVANTGNGNLAFGGASTGAATISNLQGSVSALTPPFFSGSGGTLGAGTVAGLADSTMQSFNYTFSPTARVTNNATVSLSFSNGNSAQTNLPQSVSATLTGTGVGPTYASTYYAPTTDGHTTSGPHTTITTPAPIPYTASTATKEDSAVDTISFGSLTYAANKEVLLNISNISTDINGGNSLLTDLSLLDFSIGGGSNPLDFTVPGNSAFNPSSPYTADNVIHEGDNVYLPILVTDNSVGNATLDSYLTITTDESAAFGAQGDTFTYYLSAQSISTAPEPGSLAIVSVALGGLGFARRRRRQRKQQPT